MNPCVRHTAPSVHPNRLAAGQQSGFLSLIKSPLRMVRTGCSRACFVISRPSAACQASTARVGGSGKLNCRALPFCQARRTAICQNTALPDRTNPQASDKNGISHPSELARLLCVRDGSKPIHKDTPMTATPSSATCKAGDALQSVPSHVAHRHHRAKLPPAKIRLATFRCSIVRGADG